MAIVACIFLSACNPSNALSTNDFDLFGEACTSLKILGKRTQCLATLENLKKDSKYISDSKKLAKSQETKIPIMFKDIPLGKTGSKTALVEICKQNKSNQPSKYDKKDHCEYRDEKNYIWLSYGNLGESIATIELGDNESLDSVEIKERKILILGLAEILQEKYGLPKKSINSVENKMGTKFDQEILVWVDDQGNRITVESIYDKIDQGRITIESAARIAARGVTEKAAIEVRKSNL